MIGRSMTNFFKNTHKRKCGDVAECKAAKVKASLKKNTQLKTPDNNAVMTNIWGVKNFNPILPVGEDERTLNIHKDRLLKQHNLIPYSRKQSVINTSMAKTFPLRRQHILELSKSVADIIDEYPILADPLQVSVLRFHDVCTLMSLS